MHCFTGDLAQAKYFVSKGFKLGITGFITDTRRNRETLEALKDPGIKIDDLLVETDAPWMPIRPNKISKPEDTAIIVGTIAKIKGLNEVECGKRLYRNAMDYLNIKN